MLDCGSGTTVYRDGGACEPAPVLERLSEGFGCTPKEMGAEMRVRRDLIARSGPSPDAFFREVQAKLFGYRG